MLKKLLVLTLIFVGAFSLTACDLISGDLTDVEKLDEAIADLSIALEVSDDVVLPTEGLHGVTITWESANTALFANDGTVTQPAYSEGDAVVAVKATLTLGETEYEKTFTVTVLATTVLTDLEKLAEAVPAITVVAETGSSITLPVTGLHGVEISWESSQPWYISETGAVVNPPKTMGDVEVVLTATFTSGAQSHTETYTVNVTAATELNGAEKVAAAKAAYDLGITSTSDDLDLPTEYMGVEISWESNNTMYAANDGTVTNPLFTVGDVDVVYTATFISGAARDSLQFTVTILANTFKTDMELLEEAAAVILLTVTGNVEADFVLPGVARGIPIVWTSADDTLVEVEVELSETVASISYQNIPGGWWDYNSQLDFTGFDGTQTSVVFTFTGEVGHDYLFKIEGGGAAVENGTTGDGTEQTVTLDLSTLTEAQRNGLNKLVFFVQTGGAQGNIKLSVDVPTTGAVLMASDWVGFGEMVASADITAINALVTRPENGDGNMDVVLTATLMLGTDTVTKDFTVTIKEKDPLVVYTTIAALHDTALLGDVFQFTGIVIATFDGGYFLTDGTHSLGVYNPGGIAAKKGDEITVTGSYAVYNTLYQVGNVTEEILVSEDNAITIVPVEKTVAEMLALDFGDPLTHGLYYTITGTVELRGTYDNIYLVDGENAIMIYYYSLEDSLAAVEAELGKEITITVVFYTNHGTNGPMVAFDGGAADITVNTLPDPEAMAADLAWLATEVPGITLEDIVLPAMGANGVAFTNWASSDTSLIADDGTFVARGLVPTVVTFTATATVGTVTQTATVDVLVPVPVTIGEVLAMDNGAFFEVTGVVYEESYYGIFIFANDEFAFIYNSDIIDEVAPGDEITVLGKLGEYSGLKQINVISYTNNSSGNPAVVTPMVTTVEAALNDVYMRGSILTVTGTVSIEGSYSDAMITGLTGQKIKVYYRSNAADVKTFDGKVVTLDIITYQNGTVLFNGVAADITEEVGFVATDAQKAQAAADGIDLGDIMQVTADLTLPTTEATTGATFTWATSDALVVTDAGVVTIPFGSDAMATLTVTATVGTDTATRDFMITVLDGDMGDPLTVAEALALTDGDTVLVTGVVTAFYYDEPQIQDADGTAIYVNGDITAEIGDLIVVRGILNTYTSYGNNQRRLNSPALIEIVSSGNAIFAQTDVTALDIATVANIADYSSETFTMDLTVNTIDDGFGYVFFDGTADDSVFLKFKKADFAPYFDDLYAVDDVISVTFSVYDINFDNVRLIGVIMPDLTDAEKMLVAKAATEVPATVTSDLTLPTEMYGVTITWVSANAAITNAGVVTRPANGAGDATGDLTATFTVGALTEDKVFSVTVPEEAAAPVQDLFFSEYAEADGGNCKYVEIYNPTAATVDLSTYKIIKGGNGTEFAASSDILVLSGTLASGEVLVIGNSGCVNVGDQAQDPLVSDPLFPTTGIDWLVSTVVGYVNGDDALGLFNGTEIIDVIGTNGTDPGSSWAVGNGNLTDGTTANVIMVRVASVTMGTADWSVGAQQWIVSADDRDYSTVGSHTCDDPTA